MAKAAVFPVRCDLSRPGGWRLAVEEHQDAPRHTLGEQRFFEASFLLGSSIDCHAPRCRFVRTRAAGTTPASARKFCARHKVAFRALSDAFATTFRAKFDRLFLDARVRKSSDAFEEARVISFGLIFQRKDQGANRLWVVVINSWIPDTIRCSENYEIAGKCLSLVYSLISKW